MWLLKVKVISVSYIFQVLYVLCFTWPRYQVSVYRTIGPLVIIYPENCSIQIALVKTFNRFPYCTESRKVLSYCMGLRNVLSYCMGLRRGVPDRTTFARWSPWRKNLAAIFLCRCDWRNGEFTERIDTLAMEINTETPEDAYLSFWTTYRRLPFRIVSKFMRFSSVIDMHMAGNQSQRQMLV